LTQTGDHQQQANATPVQNIWRDWKGFIVFIFIMVIFRSAVADWNQVPSGSMLPSILIGDRVIVDKLAYDLRLPLTLTRVAQWKNPQRSDIVTFESPKNGLLLIKRVIGIPGDIVSLKDNRLSVNGIAGEYEKLPVQAIHADLQMPFSHTDIFLEKLLGEERQIMLFRNPSKSTAASFQAITVPQGHYLMLGDNRDNSGDYRAIGLVPRSAIIGRAQTVAFSLNYDDYYLPRGDRFLADLK
jgi:signal peptidase I